MVQVTFTKHSQVIVTPFHCPQDWVLHYINFAQSQGWGITLEAMDTSVSTFDDIRRG